MIMFMFMYWLDFQFFCLNDYVYVMVFVNTIYILTFFYVFWLKIIFSTTLHLNFPAV